MVVVLLIFVFLGGPVGLGFGSWFEPDLHCFALMHRSIGRWRVCMWMCMCIVIVNVDVDVWVYGCMVVCVDNSGRIKRAIEVRNQSIESNGWVGARVHWCMREGVLTGLCFVFGLIWPLIESLYTYVPTYVHTCMYV